MSNAIATSLNCTQCGAELHPDEGQVFLTCPSCGSTVYLDASRVVFHWYVAPTLDQSHAEAALRRWMSGSQTVKDLDKKATVTGSRFEYFPLWYVKEQAGAKAKEVERIQPAAATSITELAQLRLPAGDLKRYDPALDSQAAPPTVPLETALEWLSADEKTMLPGSVAKPAVTRRETSLVHIPLFFFTYTFGGQPYTAVVDAASGAVIANLFPTKAETPYVLVGVVAALVFLCLAIIPIVASFSGPGDAGFTTGILICAAGGAIAAPILFFWAFWVASKI